MANFKGPESFRNRRGYLRIFQNILTYEYLYFEISCQKKSIP